MTNSEGLCSELTARCTKYNMKHEVLKGHELQGRTRLYHWLLNL